MEEKRLVWGHRGGAVRFGFCCALLVFALALTGCRFVQELFGGEEESGPPQPKSAPAPEAEAELTVSAAAFSNAADANSAEVEVSAIDAIRAALSKGVSSVLVQLEAKTDASGAPIAETVKLDDGDISGGLILTHAGDSDTSPAEVIIDGGGRTIDLTGSKQGSLITVGMALP